MSTAEAVGDEGWRILELELECVSETTFLATLLVLKSKELDDPLVA